MDNNRTIVDDAGFYVGVGECVFIIFSVFTLIKSQQPMNILIFDEPTNHMDIPAREALEKAIENFNGTLLIASHDRFFISLQAKSLRLQMESNHIYW